MIQWQYTLVHLCTLSIYIYLKCMCTLILPFYWLNLFCFPSLFGLLSAVVASFVDYFPLACRHRCCCCCCFILLRHTPHRQPHRIYILLKNISAVFLVHRVEIVRSRVWVYKWIFYMLPFSMVDTLLLPHSRLVYSLIFVWNFKHYFQKIIVISLSRPVPSPIPSICLCALYIPPQTRRIEYTHTHIYHLSVCYCIARCYCT